MNILQIAQSEQGGGASKVALNLHRGYLSTGHDARLLVKFPAIKTPGLSGINAFYGTTPWAPICKSVDNIIGRFSHFRGQRRLRELTWGIASPSRLWDWWRGIEDFNYPYSYKLLDDKEWRPDVIQLHNISTNFFDLKALEFLSHKLQVVISLHDSWAFTGHCGHPIDCERWRIGCGECPDLKRSPPVRRDNTRHNWQRKKEIYSNSRLFIASPSKWLLGLARESVLVAEEYKVIPNGIDLDCFGPGNRKDTREFLELPQDAFICLYVSGVGVKKDAYKDYFTVYKAIERIRKIISAENIVFVCVGGRPPAKHAARHRYVGYVKDPKLLSRYYHAADVFLHAANAETFGLTLIEAQACGTPVIATAVGGIPEVVRDGETGFLVPRQSSEEMANRILDLIADRAKCNRIGASAALLAKNRFGLQTQILSYLEWFRQFQSNNN